jgi:hypothetical protein
MFQDITVSLGPGLIIFNVAGTLRDARVISETKMNLEFALLAVPLAVYLWHKTTRPAPPPFASTARRVITRAAAALTLTLAAAGTVTALVLVHRHAHGVDWWNVAGPGIYAFVPLQGAGRAFQRLQPPEGSR